jgi:membrane-associated phospholipid phosphatase
MAYPLYVSGSAFIAFILGSVGVSRVYLAAHTINQVLFGFGIGIASAIFIHCSVKPALYNHLQKLS